MGDNLYNVKTVSKEDLILKINEISEAFGIKKSEITVKPVSYGGAQIFDLIFPYAPPEEAL